MPIYEYLCEECQTPYEKLVLSKSEKIACPKCGSARKTQQLSTFAAHTSPGGAGKAVREKPSCTGNPSGCGACSLPN